MIEPHTGTSASSSMFYPERSYGHYYSRGYSELTGHMSRLAQGMRELNDRLAAMARGDRAAVLRHLNWLPSPEAGFYPPELEWLPNPTCDATWVTQRLRMRSEHLVEPMAR